MSQEEEAQIDDVKTLEQTLYKDLDTKPEELSGEFDTDTGNPWQVRIDPQPEVGSMVLPVMLLRKKQDSRIC